MVEVMENITLRQARLLRELSQDYMAELLGIHVQTYRKLEENPETATIAQAKIIAAALKIPYNVIFFGE